MSYIKCMVIVYLTIFSSILSAPFQIVSYMIVCLTVFFFYLVTISDSELHKVLDYCVFDCLLFNLVTVSGGELQKGCLINPRRMREVTVLALSFVHSFILSIELQRPSLTSETR